MKIDQATLKLMDQAADRLWPEKFDLYEDEINQTACAIAADVIRQLGIFQKEGETHSFEAAAETAGVKPEQHYILRNILSFLEADGYLERKGTLYSLRKVPDLISPAEAFVHLTRTYPEEADAFQWLARAFGGMVNVLKGKVYPEDVLFPFSNFDLIESFYNTSSVYSYYSRLGGDVIRILIDHYFKKNITVLEVGAGTGNGSEHILEKSAKKISRFIFTEISRSLLKRAKNRFTAYPNIEFKLLDIMKDAASQGQEDKADIVYAVNVLHATPDVGAALKGMKALLNPGGLLVLSEIAPPEGSVYRFMELTFGILLSYYNYQDRDLRPRSPLVTQKEWIPILEKTGFRSITAVPFDRVDKITRGGVMIAVND